MRYVNFLLILITVPSLAFSQTTWYVPDDYPKIQDAVENASVVDGDTVIVRSGYYVENIQFPGKLITVKSEMGPDFTIIDGNQTGAVVNIEDGEDANFILDGFILYNGLSNSAGGGMRIDDSSPTVTNCKFFVNSAVLDGGGIWISYSSYPTLTNCTFFGNSAGNQGGGMCIDSSSSAAVTNCNFIVNSAVGNGGGMYIDSGYATVDNCAFIGNDSSISGGGIYNEGSNPTVTNCIFDGNTGKRGAGMYNSYSSPMVTNCTFDKNTGNNGEGGGMLNFYSGPSVTDCLFFGNSSVTMGGGMYNAYSNPTVTNCIFDRNNAVYLGGGMVNGASNSTVISCAFLGNSTTNIGGGMYNTNASPTVTNCTFYENFTKNYGAGMSNQNNSSPNVTNCTFSRNNAGIGGGGVSNEINSTPTVTNCILWNDIPDEIYNSSCSPLVTYTCVQGGYLGLGNINEDPLFVDPTNNDFHLTWTSPCINRGTNTGAPSDDIDGDSRPYMGTVEMGSDEFTGIHPLEADVFTLSETTGGVVNFSLFGGVPNAGRNYFILGSVTGTAPGFPLPGGIVTLPINWDIFTDLMILKLNTPAFQNFMAQLDPGTATANAVFDTMGPLSPGSAGVTISFAYALDYLASFYFVSNPINILIVP